MDQLETMGKVLSETQRIVDHIEPSQLDDPTPCTEWTVRDLLNHVTGGAEMFAIAAAEGSVPDDKLGELLAGDNLGDDYRASFRTACDRAMRAYEPPGTMEKIVVPPVRRDACRRRAEHRDLRRHHAHVGSRQGDRTEHRARPRRARRRLGARAC